MHAPAHSHPRTRTAVAASRGRRRALRQLGGVQVQAPPRPAPVPEPALGAPVLGDEPLGLPPRWVALSAPSGREGADPGEERHARLAALIFCRALSTQSSSTCDARRGLLPVGVAVDAIVAGTARAVHARDHLGGLFLLGRLEGHPPVVVHVILPAGHRGGGEGELLPFNVKSRRAPPPSCAPAFHRANDAAVPPQSRILGLTPRIQILDPRPHCQHGWILRFFYLR